MNGKLFLVLDAHLIVVYNVIDNGIDNIRLTVQKTNWRGKV